MKVKSAGLIGFVFLLSGLGRSQTAVSDQNKGVRGRNRGSATLSERRL